MHESEGRKGNEKFHITIKILKAMDDLLFVLSQMVVDDLDHCMKLNVFYHKDSQLKRNLLYCQLRQKCKNIKKENLVKCMRLEIHLIIKNQVSGFNLAVNSCYNGS